MPTDYQLKNLSWEDYDKLVKSILKQIKMLDIDILVPVLRGGCVLGMSLASNLNKPTSYIRVKRSLSNQPNSDFGEPFIIGKRDMSEIEGKNILVCEDTIDSELTIKFAKEHLLKFKPKNIFICTLINFSENLDYIAGEVYKEKKWVVFPWERLLDEED